jgi:sugar/nucleoside kinase (ribokinase family)
VLFVCGAHVDVTGRLKAKPVMATSNPGNVSHWPGGAALNMASNAAALGTATLLASPVGSDGYGQMIHDAVAARGIGDWLFEVPGATTGAYTAIIAPDGQMVIGLADLEIYETLNAERLFSCCGKAFAASPVWCVSANPDGECLAAITARKPAGTTLCAATISPAKAPRLKPILPAIDILFANLTEARALAETADATGEELARTFMAEGVTSGTISAQAGMLTWWHECEIGQLRPGKVSYIADVNGAGDALAGTVLAALAQGEIFPGAVRLGMAAGQLTLAVSEPFNPATSWPRLHDAANTIEPVAGER